MEVSGMDEGKKAETHMTSAAAFVEGGIQEACDDSCSICLEGFSDSDPSTVTNCKHEFHLQCVLEWCQRSSNCPMCWQNISLKDSTGQELLETVERERSIRLTPTRNTTVFRHPAFGDFELQHLPMGVDDAELEDRIIQHLAAAAAMGRTHRIARREGSRSRPSAHAHARPQFVLYSPQPNNGSSTAGEDTDNNQINNEGRQNMPSPVQSNQISASSSGSLVMPIAGRGLSNDNRNLMSQSSLPNQDRAGPSEDSWKSRFSSISMKYKESISKSTKEWKDKFFSRSPSMADIGSEVRREVTAGIATVSRMMERLETRDDDNNNNNNNNNNSSTANSSVTERSNDNRDTHTPDDMPLNGNNNSASFAARSISS